jgi:hypothetical protein
MPVASVDTPSLLELRALVTRRLQAYGAFEGCTAATLAKITWVIVIFGESHTALAEIDPNPDSETVIIRIQVISVILEEVIGRNGKERMCLNREVVADEPLQAYPRFEGQCGIIVSEVRVDKGEEDVGTQVGDNTRG